MAHGDTDVSSIKVWEHLQSGSKSWMPQFRCSAWLGCGLFEVCLRSIHICKTCIYTSVVSRMHLAPSIVTVSYCLEYLPVRYCVYGTAYLGAKNKVGVSARRRLRCVLERGAGEVLGD